jgi:hypothetical protein
MLLLKLGQGVAALAFFAVPVLTWAGQAQQAASPFLGEYFVTKNADPVCVPYTRNLNQFRRLDFDVCNPRLSEKYPQFTRPSWEDIPFDLGLAEAIVKNLSWYPESAERWWQAWLKASEPLRAQGRLKLWRTRIDIDGDGADETIVRMDHPLAPNRTQEEQGWRLVENPCPYRDGMLFMLESPNDFMKKQINHGAGAIGDIIHFSGGRAYRGQPNGYYATSRLTIPAYPHGEEIGATRGMKVYSLSNYGAGEACSINWVPTGHYRPLKRSRTTR